MKNICRLMDRSVKKFTLTTQKGKYLQFNEVREFTRSLKLQRKEDWYEYVKKNSLPEGIPKRPDAMYKNKGWKSWAIFLVMIFYLFLKQRNTLFH